MDTTIDRLIRRLESATGNSTEVYYSLYNDFLSTSETPGKILKTIIEYDEEIGAEDAEPIQFDEEEIKRIQNLYWPLLHETIRALLRFNYSVDDFYEELYSAVFKSALFPSDTLTSSILLEMMANGAKELPYFQLDKSVEMSKEEFSAVADGIRHSISCAIAILNRHLDTVASESSQLWKIASELNREQQIVYWGVILNVIKRSIKQ